VDHIDWDDLDKEVRHAIQARTGPASGVRSASAGLNSEIAVFVDTPSGTTFVKGLRSDHRGVVRQHREAAINPFVRSVTPRLLWQAEDAGWFLLGFEFVEGARHADYSPGSPDLPIVVELMNRLSRVPCPDIAEVKYAPSVGPTISTTRATVSCWPGTRCCTPTSIRSTF